MLLQIAPRPRAEDLFRAAIAKGQGVFEVAFKAAGMPLKWTGPVCQVKGNIDAVDQ